MIKLLDITKKYGQKEVFNNFNLNIEKNKILAVMGASGCGKTTLINILSALTSFEGQIIGGAKNVSYIFQEDRLLDNLTVYKNIEFVCGKDPNITPMLKDVEMYESRNKYIKELSGGMQKRTAIARAFCYKSELLLMDEPFSNIDIGLKSRLMQTFKKVYSRNLRTVVMATHSVDEALELSNRIIVIDKTKIILDLQNTKSQALMHILTNTLKQL